MDVPLLDGVSSYIRIRYHAGGGQLIYRGALN